MATQFETCTCSRCGGSGKYSFNPMYGDRCFKCHGAGYVLTKRGQAARAKFEELTTSLIDDVQVGDFVFDSKTAMGANKWLKVAEINHATGTISFSGNYAHTRGPGAMVRHIRNEAERLVALEKALAYQETLTKMGKPSKRATSNS